ncbi:MAG: DoxX family protein [Rhodanobacteraceae bacterium]|nr:MAG: DoxX family protein [Rhodanobacteraceae bacterium]
MATASLRDPVFHAADLVGRVGLIVLDFTAGVGKVVGYAGTAAYMTARRVPGILLPLVILTELAGSVLIVLGWHTRLVAFLLAGFTLLTLIFFHFPFHGDSGRIIFFAELAAAGGFLVLVGHGAGGWRLDARRVNRRQAVA